MLGRGIAQALRGEFALLQLDVGAHLAFLVAARKFEHREVERMKAGKGHELELVAHRPKLALELRNLRIRELFLPVEGRGAVVGEELARKLPVDAFSEMPRLRHVRHAGLAPQEIRIRGVRKTPGYGGVEPRTHAEEALYRALRGAEEGPI